MADSPVTTMARDNLRFAIVAATVITMCLIVVCGYLIAHDKMSASGFEQALQTLLVGLAGAVAGGLGGWVRGLFTETPGTHARIDAARAEGEKVAYQRALHESTHPPPMG